MRSLTPAVTPRELLLVLLAATVLRLFMPGFVEVNLEGDAGIYDLSARTLIEHGVYTLDEKPPFIPSAYRPPLYTGLLALVFLLFGHSLLAAQLTQIGISLLTIWVLYAVAAKVQPSIARWVLWLLALSPFEALYSVVFLSEGLASFLLALAFAAWILLSGWPRWILMGMVLGLATLCRDIYVLLAPFFALAWLVFGEGRVITRAKAGALLVAASLLVIAPWSIRNAVVLEKWTPISTGRLGIVLWLGGWTVDPSYDLLMRQGVYPNEAFLDAAERKAHDELLAKGDVTELDHFYLQSFRRRIEREPLKVVGRWIARAPGLWLGTRFNIFELNPRLMPYASPPWYAAKALLFAINLVFVALGVVGMVSAWRKNDQVKWLSVPIIYTAGVYLPLTSLEIRYSQPVYAILLLFTAIGAVRMVALLRERTQHASHAAATRG